MAFTRDQELEAFKTEISLPDYAASIGFVIDKRKSCRTSLTMRKNDETIVVSKGDDGHYIYFSRDESNSGTIIDFVGRYKHIGSLGLIRKELRPWIGRSAEQIREQVFKIEKSGKDRQKILKLYSALWEISEDSRVFDYLKTRAIFRDEILTARFHEKIKTDRFGAVIFPHFDELGVIGWEAKNFNFTGCPRDSEKGIWASNRFPNDEKLIICESGLDCISHLILHDEKNAWYVSTGGNFSEITERMILLAAKIHPGNEIIFAFDNDEAGEKFTSKAETILREVGKIKIRNAPVLKDWNDDLDKKRFSES